MRPSAFLAAALVAVFFMAATAHAQLFARQMRVPCAAAGILPEILARKYGEAPDRQGIANSALVQLWRNADTGSWTILLVAPDGAACVLASGEDWMAANPPEGDGT